MTFQEIYDSAQVLKKEYEVEISKKKRELKDLERKLEEQKGMLEDSKQWLKSKW